MLFYKRHLVPFPPVGRRTVSVICSRGRNPRPVLYYFRPGYCIPLYFGLASAYRLTKTPTFSGIFIYIKKKQNYILWHAHAQSFLRTFCCVCLICFQFSTSHLRVLSYQCGHEENKLFDFKYHVCCVS